MNPPDPVQLEGDDMYQPGPSETLASFLEGITAVNGPRTALTGGTGDLTYAQLLDQSTAIAGELLAHGVGKGARVGLLYGNDPRWVVMWAAISRLGAVCVPLSTLSTAPELERLIDHGDLQGLVVQDEVRGRNLVDVVGDALGVAAGAPASPSLELPDHPFLRWVLVDAPAAPGWAHSTAWVEPARPERAALVAAASARVDPADEAICIYTSGQSAAPKGVCHSHAAVMAKTFYLREMLGVEDGCELPATLPFFWVGGLVMALFTGLAAGGTVRCGEKDPRYSGAQVGSTAVMKNPFPNLRALPSLGMTETFGMYAFGKEWRAEGYPLAAPLDELQPGFELRVVDEIGHVLPDGVEGEIVVRGPSVALRIYKVEREKSFDAEGFFRTGDRGVREGERVHFLGRQSDVIKVSGANVSPAEVEEQLLLLPQIATATVVGIPQADGTTAVGAAVVLEDGVDIAAEAIRVQLAARLSPYKVPTLLAIVAADEVPMTPSLKVRMPALAKLVAARTELQAPSST